MKNGRRSKWRKIKRTKPRGPLADEVYQFGHLTIARFGRVIQFSNDADPEEHAEILKRTETMHADVIKELKRSVPALQQLIMKYDPIEVLNRAAYVLMPLFMKHRVESDYSKDEVYALPSLEYLQYLIARSPQDEPKQELDEQAWEELWGLTKAVMQRMEAYLMTRPVSDPPSQVDALRFSLDQMSLLMRVKRYPVFLPDYLRDSLKPFELELNELFGVSVDEVVQGLSMIDEYLKTGVIERYQDMSSSFIKLHAALTKAGYNMSPAATQEEQEAIQVALKSGEFKQLHEETDQKAKLALTPALFDITELTQLPKDLLSILSIRPGESVLTSLTGPNKEDLSPISTSPLHYKPFVEFNGRHYAFYHSGFEDHMSEIIESELLAKYPERRPGLEKRRSDHVELCTKELLSDILQADFTIMNAHYPDPDQPGSMTELDVLIGVDDVLFLVEVKSGAFSEGAKRGAPLELSKTLSKLIFEGQRQSERAERYIRSSEVVNFYDQTEKNIVRAIRHSDFRKIFRVVVTKENLGWIGAQLAQVSMLDPSLTKSMPWHVSLDDLRVLAELFAGDELGFVHYLQQRLIAGSIPELAQNDEIEHVGLYYKINRYHDLPIKGGDMFTFHASYMKDIDLYFSNRHSGLDAEKPTQKMPPKMRTMMIALEGSSLSKRFALASDLLDLDTKGREQVEQVIGLLQQKQLEGRAATLRLPLPKYGYGISFTLAAGENWETELRRSAVQMDKDKCFRWVVAQIDASDNLHIMNIAEIKPDQYSEEILDITRRQMETAGTQKEFRVDKIGRNQPCYCGSPQKYKHCHGALK